jgi:plastocyanin
LLALVAASLFALAGCGGSSGGPSSSPKTTSPAPAQTSSSASTTSSSGAGSSQLSLAAASGGELRYDKTSLSAKAGNVSIDFTNSSPVPHDVTIANAAGKILGATPTFASGSKTVSVSLKPGTYKFYCSVPGHRAAGMEGTLTVE